LAVRTGKALCHEPSETCAPPIFDFDWADAAANVEETGQEAGGIGGGGAYPEMAAKVSFQSPGFVRRGIGQEGLHRLQQARVVAWIAGVVLGHPTQKALLPEIKLIAVSIEAAESEPSQQVDVFHGNANEDAAGFAERRGYDSIGEG
jgi:hypothetical protein